MKLALVILLFGCGTPDTAIAQTLADAVRQHGRPVNMAIVREFSPAELPEIAKEADLIVRAIALDNGQSSLIDEGRRISSTFTFQVLDTYFSAPPIENTSNQIAVTKPGGRVTLSGQEVTAAESDFPPFEINQEYILFLRSGSSGNTWVVPYGAQGAFRIGAGGLVEQVSKDTGIWNRDKGRVHLREFLEHLKNARLP